MNFLELLQALEHRLGYQHLPLNPQASTLKQVFECSPVHHDLMRELVNALYAANACQQFTDPVNRDACFEAIGPVRQAALKTRTTDVDAYHLMENLCQGLDEIFTTERGVTKNTDAEKKPGAEIIQLDRARRRRNR